MTRIVSGSAGGRRLRTPPGDSTRPTADRVREAMFSALESMLGSLEGLRVLDLYAGSGALGLEALSRGAGYAEFVESDRHPARLIASNARELGLEGAQVVMRPVHAHLGSGRTEPFDLVVADPPYALPAADLDEVLRCLDEHGWLAADAVVVVERSRRSPELTWPEGIDTVRRRDYGETALWYGRRSDHLVTRSTPA
ncbi:16S rRNA (guanine(966)-N(2))-methyltransferase RsmD [soil metagenome]